MAQELDDLLRQREMASPAAARLRIQQAARAPGGADEAGRISETARRFNISPEVVRANPSMFDSTAASEDLAVQMARAPVLADWLNYRETNAQVGYGQLHTMADIADQIRIAREARTPGDPARMAPDEFARRLTYARQGQWEQYRQSVAAANQRILAARALNAPSAFANWLSGGDRPDSDGTLQGIARSIDSAIMGDQPVYPRLAAAYQAGDLSLGNIVRAAGAGVADVGRGAIGVGESIAGVLEDYSPIAWAERQLFGHSLEGAVHQGLTTARQGTEDLANFIAPHAQSQAGQDILSGIRSLPLSAASLAGGLYLRSARAAATLSGVIVGGQSYGEARNAGLTPLRSMIFGATDALVETGTELFPMHILIGETHAGSSFARRYVRSMLAEQGTEQIATVLQDFNQFISIDANNGKTFSQYLAERPQAALSTAIATAVGATVTNVGISAAEHVAQRFGSTLRQAATGAQTEQFLTRLAEMATASKVRERDAGSFADFVRMAAAGTGATDVYVDARQLAAVFEQGAISPEEASAMTGMAPQELAEAAARGDDVRIPIEQYATVIAPHEVNAQLMQHLRLDPDEMSPLEARTFMQDAVGQFAQEAENALAQGQQVDEARASMERVKESFVQQLSTANRFTPDVNNAYASMIASFYATMGSRLGVTAEQMAEKYQLQIKSEGVNAPSFDQSQRPAMINIGLDTNDGKGITKEEVLSALKQAGVQVLSTDEHQSDSERTLVARLDRPLTPEEAHAVSVALKQEAIAQFAGGAGELHGPQAEKWQPFNPDYFLLPDGSRMSDAAYQQEAALEDAIPGLAHVLGTLTEEEREGLKAKKAAQLVEAFESLPSAEEMASVAFAGRAKRGWHERSASTLVDIFGIEDAPRFAALLAALSPQTSVESNLFNAIQMWINWSDAGRPTDRTAIENLMASSVQGEKGPGSVLPSWVNNTVRALSTEATADIKLSGAKVSSFMLNLTGVVGEITNDTWMANYAVIDSALLNSRGVPVVQGVRGKSPTYLAMNAVVRRAAQIVTERTGETWTPAEVQETVWSWVKTLSEKRDEPGSTFAAEILAAGDLTHADIAGTPDFATLLLRGVYRGILEEGGYGDQLAAIDILEGLDSVEDEGSSAAPDGSPRPAGSVASAEGSGITAAAFLAHLEAAADRVDQLRGAGRPAAPGAGAASTYLQSKIESTLRADRASWSNDRFDQVLRALSYQSVAGQENRSKGYVVMMSPDQYLGLTLSPKGRDVVAERVAQMEEYGLGELDQAKLAAAEPIYLIVVPGAPLEGGQRVMGHEGRHRMTLLKRAGVNEVPVVVRVGQPGDLAPLNDMKLLPQRAGRSDQLSSGDTPATVYNLQPMSWANRENARRMATRDGIYFQDMIFYSALERAVEQSMTKKASAEQWIATLKKTPGVKQEELEWSGLLDFLQMQDGPVERDQLLELVRNGGIKVDEVLLGRSEADVLADYGYTVADLEDPEHEANLIVLDRELNAQFANWSSDPNNDTYRELLITLPHGVGNNPGRAPSTHWDTEAVVAHTRFMDKQDAEGNRVLFIEEVQSDWHQKGRDEGYETALSAEEMAARDQAVNEAYLRYSEADDALLKAVDAARDAVSKVVEDGRARMYDGYEQARQSLDTNDFEHWKGIVNRALGERPVEEMTNPTSIIHAYQTAIDNGASFTGKSSTLIERLRDANRDKMRAELALTEARQLASRRSEGFIPNAPFKSSWPALVMKRMIRYAVDHGYDRIAWTTGEEQADRYNLSTAVGGIRVRPSRNTVYNVNTGVIRGDIVPDAYEVRLDSDQAQEQIRRHLKETYGADDSVRMTPKQLREMFGGEIAAKMIEQADALTDPWGYADLRGAENLRVGGEGMKAFYDRNLVNIANDLIKKHGGKVTGVSLQSDEPLPRHPEVQEAKKKQAEIVNRIIALNARGGRERTQQRLDELLQVVPGHPSYMEEAKDGYVAIAAQLKEALDLYDQLPAATEAAAAAEKAHPEQRPAHPGFTITPELAKAAASGFPLFQNTGAPRGQASFAPNITSAPSIISMLRGADLSTFLHESGHFFLEVMTHVASQPNAPQEVLDDMRTILRYAGVDSLSKWQQMSTEERRVHHETFARSFEAYLFEGKAPNLEMRSLFQRFRSWLVSVYRDIKRLNVNLTDEARGVFDRMLASDEQIAEAEADRGMAPFFAQKPDEMSDAEWADYERLGLAATAEASSELERRSLRDMRFADNAGSRELKRLQRSVREKRKAVREEVAADVRRDPAYRAIEYLRTGKLDGEATDDAMKLSIEAVDKLYADKTDAERKAIKKQLGYGGNGMLAKEGADPAEVANLFGFTSGDHLIQELLLAPPINDAIEQQTEQLMRERYGDITSNDALQAATDLAIHNEVRGRFVATELAALSKAPGKRRVLNEAAKRIAHDMINRLRIRDVRPGQYEAAERRAAKEAQEAGGTKLAEAAAAKRNQLVQFHAAKTAREALAEIERGLSYLKRFGTDAAKKAISPEYMDQIEALLERFDLRRSTPLKAAQKRKTLLEWVERQRELGFEPAIDDRLLEEAQRTPYREMAVEEWRGLIDTIRNIEHLGRLKKTLLTSKAKRELNAAAEDIGNTIRVNAFKSVPEIIGAKTWWEGLRSGVADFFAMHRKLANVARTMDGKDGGATWEYLIRPMNAAGDQETLMNADATKKLGDIFKLLDKDTAKRVMVPEIGKSLSLEDRLMVALNWGNSTNRQRIADGDKWTPAQVEAILAPLTSQHWDFVEAIWRHIDSYWPQIEAKERRVSGIAPEKVEAEPFTHKLPDGTERVISGGYFPIKYDPDRSSKAAGDDQAEELRQRLQGGYTQSTTRRGHIKARVETVERPVRKDFGVIFGHVTQVIHDLSWHEYLIDANRLLRHNQIDSAVREHYGPATLKWMRKALEDIAVGDIPAQNALERAVNHIRTGVTVAGLGWNLWTSLLQPLGLSQSIVRIGPKWVARGIGDLLGNPAKLNEKLNWIYEVSPMMRMRGQTLQREINEIRNKVTAKSPLKQGFAKLVPEPMRAAVQDSFFVLIGKAQLMADLPTWVGQYEKALAGGEGADRAIALADQAVLDSQGGGQIKDLAGVQRGGPVWKLWTNFYSYFSTTYNMVADRIAGTRRVGAKDLPLLAVDVLLLTALPATVAALIRGALMGDDKDELVARVAGDNISYWLGMLIGVRETAAAVSGNAGYNGPAGARLLAELNKLGQQVRQGEADAPLARAVNNVAGIILHYPAGQLDRTVRGIGAMNRGEAGPMAPLIGPPPAHH